MRPPPTQAVIIAVRSVLLLLSVLFLYAGGVLFGYSLGYDVTDDVRNLFMLVLEFGRLVCAIIMVFIAYDSTSKAYSQIYNANVTLLCLCVISVMYTFNTPYDQRAYAFWAGVAFLEFALGILWVLFLQPVPAREGAVVVEVTKGGEVIV